MKPSLLFVSPHLDDVAFSCGGTVAACVRLGHSVTVCTIFTGSVPDPGNFALACQLDKGLDKDADYMALRRAEDREFSRISGSAAVHLKFKEAPHRGYESPAALFGGIHEGDRLSSDIAEELRLLSRPYDLVFAPQGIGGHVDHLQTILAVEQAELTARTLWYRDTPYVMRNDVPTHSAAVQLYCDTGSTLEQKIDGCLAYRTQIPFQFGGPDKLRTSLTGFHAAEATSGDCSFRYAECFASDLRLAEEFVAWYGQCQISLRTPASAR